MNTIDLKKNCKEELIIYIEKLSRDMAKIQEENLELRRKCQTLEKEIENLTTNKK
jgi:cell division septum initiation protein DivIVA